MSYSLAVEQLRFAFQLMPVLVILLGGLIVLNSQKTSLARAAGAAIFGFGLFAYAGITFALG